MTARLAARICAPTGVASWTQNRDRGAGAVEYVGVILIAVALITAVFPPLREFVMNMVHNIQMPQIG